MTIKRPLVINQPDFGKLIRELHFLTRLTQEQFTAQLGVTYATVNCWENRRAKPSPLGMEKIEEILRDMGEQGKDFLAKYLTD